MPDRSGQKRQAAETVVPVFGIKNHVGIDKALGFIRRSTLTHDGDLLVALLDRDNLASGVWADTTYHSEANLALLDRRRLTPQFQRAKPRCSQGRLVIAPAASTWTAPGLAHHYGPLNH